MPIPELSNKKEELTPEMTQRVIDKMVARGELVRTPDGVQLTRKGRKAAAARKRAKV